MALALVPRARGRREKIAKSGKKITTFDPILEGTRRVYFGSWSAIQCPRNLPSARDPRRNGRKNGPRSGGVEHRSGSRGPRPV